MSNGPAANLQPGHIGLTVTDLERATSFYAEAFGFRIQGRSEREGRRYAFLGDGERLVLTLWQQSEGHFDAAHAGLHHLSFQVPTLDDVRDAEARVRALGAPIHHAGIVAHGPEADSGGLFFEDPDGIRLEIYAPAGLAGMPAPIADGPTCGFF